MHNLRTIDALAPSDKLFDEPSASLLRPLKKIVLVLYVFKAVIPGFSPDGGVKTFEFSRGHLITYAGETSENRLSNKAQDWQRFLRSSLGKPAIMRQP
jgi:hypothetical protein